MIESTETVFEKDKFVIVQMAVPTDEWERIKISKEWQKIINGDFETEKAEIGNKKADTETNARCQQVETIKVPKAYFDNMQKTLEDAISEITVKDIKSMEKFVYLHKWLGFNEVKKGSS